MVSSHNDFVAGANELILDNRALIDLMQTILHREKLFKFLAKGASMSPFIRNGDIVTIAPLPVKLPRVGEVIAFVHPRSGKLTIHRIIKRRGTSFFLRGDNSVGIDGRIELGDILGVLVNVERQGRKISLGLSGNQGVAVAFLVRKGWLKFLVYFYRKRCSVCPENAGIPITGFLIG